MALAPHTRNPDARDRLTVQAYVRPSLLLDPVDGKIGTLEALDAAGAVDEVTVDGWPATVPLEAEPAFPEVIETFERFEAWAEATGASIRPPFIVRTQSSELTGETKRLLQLPIICLAIERNGQLVNVVPHSDGDTHRSVTDALAALDPSDDNVGGASDAGDGREEPPTRATWRRMYRPETDGGYPPAP